MDASTGHSALVRRVAGAAGEIGNLPTGLHAGRCPYRHTGCLEMFATGSGIARRWSGGDRWPTVSLFEKGLAVNPQAKTIQKRFFQVTATAIRVLGLAWDPRHLHRPKRPRTTAAQRNPPGAGPHGRAVTVSRRAGPGTPVSGSFRPGCLLAQSAPRSRPPSDYALTSNQQPATSKEITWQKSSSPATSRSRRPRLLDHRTRSSRRPAP